MTTVLCAGKGISGGERGLSVGSMMHGIVNFCGDERREEERERDGRVIYGH